MIVLGMGCELDQFCYNVEKRDEAKDEGQQGAEIAEGTCKSVGLQVGGAGGGGD